MKMAVLESDTPILKEGLRSKRSTKVAIDPRYDDT
jgi:hypothetical protein